jgi:dienelactone hydrolase
VLIPHRRRRAAYSIALLLVCTGGASACTGAQSPARSDSDEEAGDGDGSDLPGTIITSPRADSGQGGGRDGGDGALDAAHAELDGAAGARDATAGERDGRALAGDGGVLDREGGDAARDGGQASAVDSASASESDGAAPPDGAAAASDCTAKLLPLPEDPKQRGPWDVGVRTVKVGRLNVEIVYPAKPGSTQGVPVATYDIRKWLPEKEQEKVPADHSPAVQPLNGPLYRDVPIDDAHGPYPVVIFIHGTASFRIASGTTNAHWASRGFIVLAADYPGLGLSDQLSATLECGYPQSGAQDLPGDVKAQIDALTSPTGDLAFLGSRADTTRLAISGHSQGGCVSATLSTLPNVRIVMPFSGSTPVAESASLRSILYVSGMNDTVIGYNFPLIGNVVCPIGSATTELAYEFSPGPQKVKKRLVGISGGGHLVVTDLCQKNAQGKNAIQEAGENRVCGVSSAVIIGLPALFDCGTIDWKVGLEAVNYATSAALEETLHCKDRSAQFSSLKTNLPQVGDFREATRTN